MVFLAAAVVVAFFAAAPVAAFLPGAAFVGFTIVVPVDAFEVVVLELTLRSFCSRVAGLAGAALVAAGFVVVFLACVVALVVVAAPCGVIFRVAAAVLLVARALALSTIPARLAVAVLTGLACLSGEVGRIYDGC